ncbi:MAG: TonB family protein [Pseudomonadota bacterium]
MAALCVGQGGGGRAGAKAAGAYIRSSAALDRRGANAVRQNGLGWAVTLSMFAHAALLFVLVWRSETPQMHGAGVQAMAVELVPATPVEAAEELEEAEEPPVETAETTEEPPTEAGAEATAATPEEVVRERGTPPGFVPINPNIGAPTALVGGRGSAVDETAEATEVSGEGEAEGEALPDITETDEAAEEVAEAESAEVAEAEPAEPVEEAADTPTEEVVETAEVEPSEVAEAEVPGEVEPTDVEPTEAEAPVEPEEALAAEASEAAGEEALTPPGELDGDLEGVEEDAPSALDDVLVSEAPADDVIAVPRNKPPVPATSVTSRGVPAVSWAAALSAPPQIARPDSAAIGYTEAIRSAVAPIFFSLMASVPSSGTVMVDVRIARDGSVLDARLSQTSGSFDLDTAALKAVKTAQYPPLPPEIRENALRVRIPLRAF